MGGGEIAGHELGASLGRSARRGGGGQRDCLVISSRIYLLIDTLYVGGGRGAVVSTLHISKPASTRG